MFVVRRFVFSYIAIFVLCRPWFQSCYDAQRSSVVRIW